MKLKPRLLALALALTPLPALSTPPDPAGITPDADLFELSLEQLMDVVVTSVSKRSQPLSSAAAAVHVISAEDIRRSGATMDIPDGIPTTLFDRLRAWRFATAKERNVPAYVVFQDATLREIAIKRPRTLSELAAISGVGDRKLEHYGAAILEMVAQAG